jgi:hypothetical protein
MSLLLHGQLDDITRLSKYIRHYKSLCERYNFILIRSFCYGLFRDGKIPDVEEESSLKQSWIVETKYYSANVSLRLLDYSSETGLDEKLEGIILIPHKEKVETVYSFFCL